MVVHTPSRRRWLLSTVATALLFASCQRTVDPEGNNVEVEGGYEVTLRWTNNGIPHVNAADFGSLGFGIGWVKAHAGLCTIAREVRAVRGESARYFGAEEGRLQRDTAWRALLTDELVTRSLAEQSVPARELLDGAVAGYNRYLHDYPPEHRPTDCRAAEWVTTIDAPDLMRLLLASGLGRGDGNPRIAPQPSAPGSDGFAGQHGPLSPTAIAGGTALAFGAERSATGRGLLYSRTRAHWHNAGRGFVMHLTVPGKLDVIGTSELAGTLLPHSGFSEAVAWTRSSAPTQRLTLYILEMPAGQRASYRFGDQLRRFERRTITVEVRDSRGEVREQSRTGDVSHLGLALIPQSAPNTPGKALVPVDASLRPDRSTEMLLRLASARNVADISAALRSTQADGRFALTAVDREGQVLYADLGRVPNLDYGFLQRCGIPLSTDWVGVPATPLRGDPQCVWPSDQNAAAAGLMAPSRMPMLEHRDFLHVAGDGHWLVHPSTRLEGFSPLFGGEGGARSLRARSQSLTVASLPAKVSTANLQSLASRTDEPLLRTLRDDMLTVCARSGGRVELANGNPADLRTPCAALRAWDGRFAPSSRGAALWAAFWPLAQRVDNLWATPYRLDAPLATPAGLNLASEPVREGLLRALVEALDALAAAGVTPDAPLGTIQYVELRGKRIGVAGAPEAIGAASVLEVQRSGNGPARVVAGDSYVQIVGWTRDGAPQGLLQLPHGQAAEHDAPERFATSAAAANGQWITAPFSAAAIEAAGVTRTLHLLDERTMDEQAHE